MLHHLLDTIREHIQEDLIIDIIGFDCFYGLRRPSGNWSRVVRAHLTHHACIVPMLEIVRWVSGYLWNSLTRKLLLELF
jgi:hypothetical protein